MNFILSFLGLIFFAVIAFIMGAVVMLLFIPYALISCSDADYKKFISKFEKARQKRSPSNENF